MVLRVVALYITGAALGYIIITLVRYRRVTDIDLVISGCAAIIAIALMYFSSRIGL